MANQLMGKKILVLVANGVDESVMSCVQREFTQTGAEIKTVSTLSGLVSSWNNNTAGLYFPVDQHINQTMGSDFDALVVPSGMRAIQKLAENPHTKRIISSFITAEKPMAMMGDAISLLAKIELAHGWAVAGPDNVQKDVVAAGAAWTGQDITIDRTLLTGACTDISAFISRIISHFESDMPSMQIAA